MSDPRPSGLPHEPAPELQEARVSGEPVYVGRLLQIQRDIARTPDGHESVREYTLHPGAAAMLPMLDDGRLLLERQWRFPMNRSFLEIPAGKIDAGEHPLETAIRELREETGHEAREWAYIGPMHPVISYSTEVIHLYAARGLEVGVAALEPGECLRLEWLSQEDFLAQTQQPHQTITDAKTLFAALWLSQVQAGILKPEWLSAEALMARQPKEQMT